MATAVLLPSGRYPRPQSILLQHPTYIPSVPSAARTTTTMRGSRSPNDRRIRFAPLPDPRRSVLITDDGNELPFPQPIFATQFPAPPTPSPTVDPRRDYFTSLDSASLSSSSSESKPNSDSIDPSSSSSVSSTPGTATPISITTTSPSEVDNNNSVPPSPVVCPPSPFSVSSRLSVVSAPSTPSSKKSTFSFFRNFKRNSTASSSSSSNTLTPVASIDRAQTPTGSIFSRRNFSVSAEEVLTLGTINLFRTSSSRDTDDNEGPSSGWSLARWSSAGSSASHHKDKEPSWGHPLARASSTQSYQSKSKSTKSNSRARPITSRKGMRMLNGRVYGVKRPQNANVNPFANARDDEPEFVEWGYGGMGSVKGATSAGAHGRWERLHGTSTTAKTAVVGDDEDDGSGMAWIKKRREQREREKREQEEKERLEREALEKAESADTETPLPTTTLLSPQHTSRPGTASSAIPSRPGTANSARTVSASSTTTITPSNVSSATLSPPPIPSLCLPLPSPSSLLTPMPCCAPLSTTATPATAVANSAEEEHVTRAVNIPAPAHYHHRHSRAGSKDIHQTMVADLASLPASPRKESAISSHQRQQSDSPSATSESESESDAEREDEEDESDEEEDSDEEEKRLEESRKTARGAGVEKISRHH
ncbi:hypothetical protein AN958_02485 [Leucoagaricus sp. SymC.cos]|nr:hypothetical protein AN958_02485 [Leucoagaricus sp. SymC.cos]